MVLKELLRWRDLGKISIGFSMFTIVEFVTKPDEKHRAERVARGELIKHVCGSNAFPDLQELARGARFPNGGMWIGSPSRKLVNASSFRRQLARVAKEELSNLPVLNRAARRKYGTIKQIYELANKLNTGWGRNRADWQGIPISNELLKSRLFERFVKGQCTDREFESSLNGWMSDPGEFSRIFYDYYGSENLMDAYFADHVSKIQGAVELLEKHNEMVAEHNAAVLLLRKELQALGMPAGKARQRLKRYELPATVFESIEVSLERVLGLGRARHFKHYCVELAKRPEMFKRSDVFDLMQMCYAYECDLFRCDKAMADVFKKFDPFSGRLVSRFEQLIHLIENRLSTA